MRERERILVCISNCEPERPHLERAERDSIKAYQGVCSLNTTTLFKQQQQTITIFERERALNHTPWPDPEKSERERQRQRDNDNIC